MRGGWGGNVEVRHDLPKPKELLDVYINGWSAHPAEPEGKWKEPHGRVVLLKGASLLPGTVEAEVDKAGDIHLAIYASSDASTNTVVRYLKIGK